MFVAVAVLLAQVPVSSPAALPFVSLEAVRTDGGFALMGGTGTGMTSLMSLGDDGIQSPNVSVLGFPGALYADPTGVTVIAASSSVVSRTRIVSGLLSTAQLFVFDAGVRDGGLPLLGGIRESAGGLTASGADVAAWSFDQTFNNPDIFLNGALVGVGNGLRFCGATPLLLFQRLPSNPMLLLPDLVVARALDGGQLGSESGLLVSCTGALGRTWAVVRGTEGPLGEDGGPPVLWSPEQGLAVDLQSDRVVDVDFDGVSLWTLINEDAGVSVRRYTPASASPLEATPVALLPFPVSEPRLTLSAPGRGLLTYTTVTGGGAYVFVGGGRLGDPCSGSSVCYVGACVAGQCALVVSPDAGPGDAGRPDAGLDAGSPDAGPADAGIDAGTRLDAGVPPLDGGLPDAGAQDAGAQDAGTQDAGAQDAGTQDAGTQDAGTQDAGTQDAGTQDAGTQDAGTQDAGTQDAGTQDAGASDAGTSDASVPDASVSFDGGVDASVLDAGTPDAGRVDAGPGERLELQVGCGCTSGGTMAALFALVSLLLGRRRT